MSEEEEAAKRIAEALLRSMGPQEARKAVRQKVVRMSDLKIIDKDRNLLPLRPNSVQRQYAKKLNPDWTPENPTLQLSGVRDLILKARKQGFSTFINGIYFLDTINNRNTESVLMADDAPNTEKLFQMIRRYFEYLDDDLKPDPKYASKRQFFWPDIESWYTVTQAGSPNAGRGGTPRNIHLSEVAFYPNAADIVAGLMESVPDRGNIIIESTANGVGTWQHKEWIKALEGNSVFRPIFVPWFDNPEYRASDLQMAQHWGDITTEEVKMMDRYRLDERQMCWYRIKKKALGEMVFQENPSNWEESFLSSGQPYFDMHVLKDRMTKAEKNEPVALWIPEEFPTLRRYAEMLTVYELPDPGHTYVVTADTAEGLTEEGDPDYDSADILDADTGTQVAHFHGLLDTNQFGLALAELGWWYNTALVAVERNNHGHAVINSLLYNADYPEMIEGMNYGVYYHEDYDNETPLQSRKPGWPTTPKTKYFALDCLKSSIEEDTLELRHPLTISECMSFVKKPRGKAGANPGAKDDRVMSIAIAAALQKLGYIRYTTPMAGGDVRTETIYNPLVLATVRENRPPGLSMTWGR